MVLQVLRLNRNTHGRWTKECNALASGPTYTRVVHARAANTTQFSRKCLAQCITDRIEQISLITSLKLFHIVQFCIDATNKNPHVLISRAIGRVSSEPAEMVAGFRYRRRKISRRIVGAVQCVREPSTLRVQVRKRRHDVARARAAYPIFDRDEVNVPDFVPHAGIGEHLCCDQCIPNGRVG